MQRTIRFPLLPTLEQESALFETIQQYTACFNTVATYAWEKGEKNGVELHKTTYYPLRADYLQLPAQLVISARVKATEAVKSALTWKVKREREYPKKFAKAIARGQTAPTFKPMHCPQSTNCAIRYDQRSYRVFGDCVSLATIQGRQVLALHLYP
jgi:putative transposase